MSRQVNSGDPGAGYPSKRDFDQKGQISDADLTIVAVNDPTKKVIFDASGVPTGSTVTITIPNASTSVGIKYAKVWEQQAEGVAAGASVSAAFGATSVRTLNQSSDPDNIGITVASNKITLPAGNYILRIQAPFFQVADCQLRLYDVTNSAVIAYGQTNYSGAGDTTEAVCHLVTRVAPTAATDYRIEYHAGGVVATNGLGVPTSGITVSGHVEIYTQVEIIKY